MKSHHLVARECCKVSTIKFNFPRKKIYVSKRNRRDTGEKIVETSHQKALLFTYFLLFIFFPKGNILTEGLKKNLLSTIAKTVSFFTVKVKEC